MSSQSDGSSTLSVRLFTLVDVAGESAIPVRWSEQPLASKHRDQVRVLRKSCTVYISIMHFLTPKIEHDACWRVLAFASSRDAVSHPSSHTELRNSKPVGVL